MKLRPHLAALFIAAAPAAHAADYLTEIISDVHQAPGMSVEQLVDRGLQCIKSSSHNAAEYITPAVDGDTAYGIVRFEYSHLMVPDLIRARVSVVAREGRFRVAHTSIERYSEFTRGYIRVHTGFGGKSDKVRQVLAEHADKIAACITNPPDVAGGDW